MAAACGQICCIIHFVHVYNIQALDLPAVSESTQSEVVSVQEEKKTSTVLTDTETQDYVVEFEESSQDHLPPKIVQPLQPIAVNEGLLYF